ncbi:MAG: protein-L-isoaspartate(D-aspartate) O-methyltransferase [Sulfuricurvum sp.]
MLVLNKITASRVAKMVDECEKHFPLSKSVREAMCRVDREEFVPAGLRSNAYKLDPLPLSANQWISSPLTVAKMSEYIIARPYDRVLEVGCGSGYQAAVLSGLFRGVFTIERVEHLLLEALDRFRRLEIANISAKVGDGQEGWKQYAPYDRILFSATADEIPQALFDQLADDGVLVAPMRTGNTQTIVRFIKSGGSISKEELEECDFVPIVSGVIK